MIARVSQLRIDPARVDEAVGVVRSELVPAVMETTGAVDGRWMVAPETGEVLTVVRWDDAEAMFAAAADLAGVRDTLVRRLRATPVSMQVHEVVGVVIEAPLDPGVDAWSRVVRLGGLTESGMSDGAALFRVVVDEHQGKPGFLSAHWSGDPTTGSGLGLSTWTTEAAAGDDVTAVALRDEVARALGATVVAVGRYLTVGSTPAEHVLDLAAIERSSTRVNG